MPLTRRQKKREQRILKMYKQLPIDKVSSDASDSSVVEEETLVSGESKNEACDDVITPVEGKDVGEMSVSGRVREGASAMLGDFVGSETAFDLVCSPCSEDSNREAVGFCVDCGEWLCGECFSIHTRPKPSRHHVLLTREQVDTHSGTTAYMMADKSTEKCGQHASKKLKYFCHVHDHLGCSMCIFENHRNCSVKQISDVASDIGGMKEYKTLIGKLAKVADASREVVNDVKHKIEMTAKSRQEAQNLFRKYQEECIAALNAAEKSFQEDCDSRNDNEVDKFENIARNCEDIEKECLNMKSQLENLESSGQCCNTFVAMKRSTGRLQKLESQVNKAIDSSVLSVYEFIPNSVAIETLKGNGAGTFVKKWHIFADSKAQPLPDIPIKSKGENVCLITSAVLLSPDKLVIIDNYNCRVKVVDTNQNVLVSELEVDGKPWGVCKESESTVAVTLYDEQCVLFVRVDAAGKLSVDRSVKVSGQCRGVAVAGDRLLLSFTSPPRLEILTLDGTLIRVLEMDADGHRLFKAPQYLALSVDAATLYVSDLKKNAVVCLSLEDDAILAKYEDRDLKKPEQIVVDANGTVYVAGLNSGNVHVVTSGCRRIRVLLDATDGVNDVFSLSFCDRTNKLYVGMHKSNVVKVFRLG